MLLAARRAAPVAVLLACALAAGPARAQDSSLPPLSDQPAVPLSGDATATPTATATATAPPVAAPERPQLARTGADPLVVALSGLGLLGTGLGLRRLADGAL
jgi:hypothetical protein